MRGCNQISPENQRLLNKIVHQLATSLQKQMVEFVDVLLDGLTAASTNKRNLVASLVRGTEIPIFDEDDSMVYRDLGFNDLVGIVHLRNLILELRGPAKPDAPDAAYVHRVLRQLDLVRDYFVYLLECLGSYLELPTCTGTYRATLVELLPCFELFFADMRSFKRIAAQLLHDARETGASDSSTFAVEDSVLLEIEALERRKIQFRGLVAGLDVKPC
ncbi:AaceriAFL013Cp [[Ashbya] aceris (nom. inval.)]|nr:AaceriAFL013Cp [[Ashbya] aceris (nom. inval.)]